MSNVFVSVNNSNLGWVKNQVEQLCQNDPTVKESEILTYLDSLATNIEWADVRVTQVPFEKIYTVRMVTGPSFACFHIRLRQDIQGQIRDLAYENWKRSGGPAGRDSEMWEEARLQLESNLEQWRIMYGRQ